MVPGTLVFTDIKGRTVNNATGLVWTHVLISLDQVLYEATWPVVKKSSEFPPATKNLYILPPETPYSKSQISLMLAFAEKNLGRRYMLRGYVFPNWYGKVRGVYCSEFVCRVLQAGNVDIPLAAGYTPDALYTAITGLDP